jgi:hypothetical protein
MRLITLLLFISLGLGMSACTRATSYFPLEAGATWEYTVEYPTMFSGPKKAKLVSRIEGTQTIDGKTYFKMVTVSSGMPGAKDGTTFYRIGDDGVYQHDGNEEQLFLPSSLKEGTSWTINGPNGALHYRVEGIETAHLVDKTYENCIKISYEGDHAVSGLPWQQTARIKGVVYRAKGIGEVKSFMEGPGGTAEFSLEKYER